MAEISSVLTCPRVLGVKPKHPWDEYLSERYMNPSTLVNGAKSMKHLKDAWDNPEFKDSDDKQTGRAIHCLVYEPHEFEKRFCWFKGTRNPSHAAYQEFMAKHEGMEILTKTQWDKAIEAGKAFLKDKLVRERFGDGAAEVTLYGEIDGVQFKGRIDWIESDMIIDDLKTSKNIMARAFGRDFYDYGYDIKLGIYRELFSQNSFGLVAPVNVICLEKERPYDSAVIPVPEAVLDRGLNKARSIISRMKECIEKDEWPGVANGELYYLDTPPWEMDDEPATTS